MSDVLAKIQLRCAVNRIKLPPDCIPPLTDAQQREFQENTCPTLAAECYSVYDGLSQLDRTGKLMGTSLLSALGDDFQSQFQVIKDKMERLNVEATDKKKAAMRTSKRPGAKHRERAAQQLEEANSQLQELEKSRIVFNECMSLLRSSKALWISQYWKRLLLEKIAQSPNGSFDPHEVDWSLPKDIPVPCANQVTAHRATPVPVEVKGSGSKDMAAQQPQEMQKRRVPSEDNGDVQDLASEIQSHTGEDQQPQVVPVVLHGESQASSGSEPVQNSEGTLLQLSLPVAQEGNGDTEEENLCVCCMEQPRCFMMSQCLHSICCRSCRRRLVHQGLTAQNLGKKVPTKRELTNRHLERTKILCPLCRHEGLLIRFEGKLHNSESLPTAQCTQGEGAEHGMDTGVKGS
eukprot:gnl/TRDRNA2_/TRDRNA2_133529_c1_seq1.p1 gnl/TRDRNA2_/TRDRNA2_133529_c1~~gnl/TRDRNA2_/TRDRNA2_133529_c1_seq1.p1  ORF type:complete len:404 (-),score=49.34 gnl/TRDRNA2_/TRDRNA2_133529_c1_seq1:93-1304(-)